ncbi:MAG: peptidase Ste24p [Pseudonocardiales bacterium]|nr:peptidase Ste24p [Pseudonocardiales bacterium]
MIALAAIPFVFAIVLHVTSPAIGRKLPPALATWLLSILSLTTALTGGLVLSTVAVVSFARLQIAGQLGHWSPSAVGTGGAPPLWLGAPAAVVVAGLLLAAVMRGVASVRATTSAHRALRGLQSGDTNLVLLDHDLPTAYAVGGLHGRIVVSTAMLKALPANERRVLLAHEAAHIRHHHHLFVQVCEVSAAANPLLGRSVAAVRSSVERWADEIAADEVGDRQLAARGLARAALARAGSRTLAGTLAGADGEVVVRVRALMTEPLRHRLPLSGSLLAAVVACWSATVVFVFRAHAVIELAENVRYR